MGKRGRYEDNEWVGGCIYGAGRGRNKTEMELRDITNKKHREKNEWNGSVEGEGNQNFLQIKYI